MSCNDIFQEICLKCDVSCSCVKGRYTVKKFIKSNQRSLNYWNSRIITALKECESSSPKNVTEIHRDWLIRLAPQINSSKTDSYSAFHSFKITKSNRHLKKYLGLMDNCFFSELAKKMDL